MKHITLALLISIITGCTSAQMSKVGNGLQAFGNGVNGTSDERLKEIQAYNRQQLIIEQNRQILDNQRREKLEEDMEKINEKFPVD